MSKVKLSVVESSADEATVCANFERVRDALQILSQIGVINEYEFGYAKGSARALEYITELAPDAVPILAQTLEDMNDLFNDVWCFLDDMKDMQLDGCSVDEKLLAKAIAGTFELNPIEGENIACLLQSRFAGAPVGLVEVSKKQTVHQTNPG